MGVHLSKSAWHYRLQKYAYGKNPETFNFCPYFWWTVLAFLFLPTAMLGGLTAPYLDNHYTPNVYGSNGTRYDGTRDESNIDVGYKTIMLALFAALVLGLVGSFFYLITLVLMAPKGVLVLLGSIGLIALLGALVYTSGFWMTYLFAIKDKVCPIITWSE